MEQCANCGANKIDGPECPYCHAIYARAEAVYEKRRAREAACTDSKPISCPAYEADVNKLTKYNEKYIKILLATSLFILIILAGYFSFDYIKKKYIETAHNGNVVDIKTIASPLDYLDVSSLIGKDIDFIEGEFGAPREDLGRTNGGNIKSWTVGLYSLTIVYEANSKKITHLFVQPNKPEIVTEDKILQRHGLRKDDSRYSVDFMEITGSPGAYNGVEITVSDRNDVHVDNLAKKNLDQIELIGLIPGISTKYQVESISKNSYSNRFEIGRYLLSCYPEYTDGILSVFMCLTGEDDLSYDIASDVHREVSNVEVHESLLKGLTEKFGQPINVSNEIVHNHFGAKFNKSTAIWEDKNKNYLLIESVHEKVGQGMLLMISGKTYSDFVKKQEAVENSRNF